MFAPAAFRLDRMRNASAQVFDHLRERIVTLDLEPGTQLQREELAAYFELSATPIRDALTRLSEEGLVDIVPKQATVVKRIDVDSARQAHFLRLSLELEIAHLLASSPTPALIGTLELLLSQQALALSHQDYDAFVRADQAFHRQMYVAARAEELWHWMRSQSGNLDRLKRLHLPLSGKAAQVMADHAAIVAAIAAGDARLAQLKVREHLSGTLARLEEIRARYPDYVSPDPEPVRSR